MSKPGCENIAVNQLKPGDYVDLEGDAWADMPTDPAMPSPYEYEYAIVAIITPDVDDFILVEFEDGNEVAFPDDHLVPLVVTH